MAALAVRFAPVWPELPRKDLVAVVALKAPFMHGSAFVLRVRLIQDRPRTDTASRGGLLLGARLAIPGAFQGNEGATQASLTVTALEASQVEEFI